MQMGNALGLTFYLAIVASSERIHRNRVYLSVTYRQRRSAFRISSRVSQSRALLIFASVGAAIRCTRFLSSIDPLSCTKIGAFVKEPQEGFGTF